MSLNFDIWGYVNLMMRDWISFFSIDDLYLGVFFVIYLNCGGRLILEYL